MEQLGTAKEVRDHFQKAVEKSKEIFDSGEGDVSQSDLTKLKLGLSNTLNNIIDLKHGLQIGKLNLGKLINQELQGDNDIMLRDPTPIDFPYTSFDDFLKAKNLNSQSKKITDKLGIVSTEIHIEQSIKLTKENRLLLYKAFLDVTVSKVLNVVAILPLENDNAVDCAEPSLVPTTVITPVVLALSSRMTVAAIFGVVLDTAILAEAALPPSIPTPTSAFLNDVARRTHPRRPFSEAAPSLGASFSRDARGAAGSAAPSSSPGRRSSTSTRSTDSSQAAPEGK